jgi:predicted transcriptional regulator
MSRFSPPRPTDAELSILRVLWQHGPSTVRQVLDTLSQTRSIGYTTVLKLLQIMIEKGLVRRDESGRTHIYEARFSEQQTQRQLVSDLVDRAFGGSAMKLVMQALDGPRTSPAELAEVRRLLEDREGRSAAIEGHRADPAPPRPKEESGDRR